MKNIFASTIAALAIVAGATNVSTAQEKTLRLADSLPATHLFTKEVALPWMEAVTKATDGKIKFQHYPAEQLGKAKDMLSLVNSGVADMAFVVPIYITDKLPLSGVYDLPGGPYTSCQGVKAFMDLATGDGILAKQEYGPNHVRVLMAVVQPPFQVFTAEKKIESIADLRGLKLRTAGGAQDVTASKLGIVPVKITAPETSEAMSRGTIDGGILAHVSIGAYGLTDLIKYATDGANFGSAVLTWSISEPVFQSLDPEIRKIMVEKGQEATMSACKSIERGVFDAIASWKAKGVKIVEFPDAEQEQLASMFESVGHQWAHGLDVRGKPGTEVLNAFEAALDRMK